MIKRTGQWRPLSGVLEMEIRWQSAEMLTEQDREKNLLTWWRYVVTITNRTNTAAKMFTEGVIKRGVTPPQALINPLLALLVS